MPPQPRQQAAAAAADLPPSVGIPEDRTHASQKIEATSLAERGVPPDEVTLRFNKWHSFGNTAYQAGDFAGFKRHVAARLIQSGAAVLAETPQQVERTAADRFMVTK